MSHVLFHRAICPILVLHAGRPLRRIFPLPLWNHPRYLQSSEFIDAFRVLKPVIILQYGAKICLITPNSWLAVSPNQNWDQQSVMCNVFMPFCDAIKTVLDYIQTRHIDLLSLFPKRKFYPDMFFFSPQNCIYDSCNCENSEACMCAALSSYVHACAAKGILLTGWRDTACSEWPCALWIPQ